VIAIKNIFFVILNYTNFYKFPNFYKNMVTNIEASFQRRVIMIPKFIPIKWVEIKELVPVRFVKTCGKYFPVEYKEISKYIPTSFVRVEKPLYTLE